MRLLYFCLRYSHMTIDGRSAGHIEKCKHCTSAQGWIGSLELLLIALIKQIGMPHLYGRPYYLCHLNLFWHYALLCRDLHVPIEIDQFYFRLIRSDEFKLENQMKRIFVWWNVDFFLAIVDDLYIYLCLGPTCTIHEYIGTIFKFIYQMKVRLQCTCSTLYNC